MFQKNNDRVFFIFSMFNGARKPFNYFVNHSIIFIQINDQFSNQNKTTLLGVLGCF